MKKIKLFFGLFLIVSLGLSSCANDSDAIAVNPDPTPGEASFAVTFDNQTYVAMQIDAVVIDSQILINAFKLPGLESFSISLDGNTAGTYEAKENSVSYSPGFNSSEIYTSQNPEDNDADTGQIVITSVNTTSKTISGTFNFTGYYQIAPGQVLTKSFTNGAFNNIPYTTE